MRREGLAGLSLRDLARSVGMQAPSLYSYFASKHAIYDAMFAQGSEEFVAREATLEPSGDRLRDLQAGMRMFVEFCTEDPSATSCSSSGPSRGSNRRPSRSPSRSAASKASVAGSLPSGSPTPGPSTS